MGAIPSIAWLVIGAAVVGISSYVGMPMFFWIGWLFIVMGIARLVIGFMIGKKETKTEKKTVQQAMPQHHGYVSKYYRCVCGNPVKITDNFCGYCGRRLR
jgi:hypothetical protein